jgi:hypothetical protein
VKKMLLALALVLSAGCKQGLGDRCQVNDDCTTGICSQSTPKVCVTQNGQTDQIDAMLPLDATAATATATTTSGATGP